MAETPSRKGGGAGGAQKQPGGASTLRLRRLTAYVDERRRIPSAAFLTAYPDPVLVHRLTRGHEDREYNTVQALKTIPPGAPEMTNARVVFRIRKRPGGAFHERIGVGRAPNSDVTLPYSAVSKYHAYISQESDGRYAITDMGSSNGTTVNGVRLEPRTAAPLEDGSIIVLAGFEFVFYTPEGFSDFLIRLHGPGAD